MGATVRPQGSMTEDLVEASHSSSSVQESWEWVKSRLFPRVVQPVNRVLFRGWKSPQASEKFRLEDAHEISVEEFRRQIKMGGQ